MSWVLVANLVNLRAQINAWAPNRSHASDGTIGDTAHQAEMSGHNPDDTTGSLADYNDHDGVQEVRAFDCDVNFGNGSNAQDLVDHIRDLPGIGTYIRYIIYNRKMYHVRDGFSPTDYTGSNPHTEHIHFESAWNQTADRNSSFDYRLADIEIMLSAEDLNRIQQIVWAPLVDSNNGPLSETPVGHAVGVQQWPDGTQTGDPLVPYYQAFLGLAHTLMNVKAAVATIENQVETILTVIQHGVQ